MARREIFEEKMPGSELIGEEELTEIRKIFSLDKRLSRVSFGPDEQDKSRVSQFETAFAHKMNASGALATTSGTSALRVALASLGISHGDEVVTSSFTFVATAEAIVESSAKAVFTEIDEHLNMDPDDLERKITGKTRAVIAVHMLGTPANLPAISAICQRQGVPLIEDCAWGCGGNFNGKNLGTWGDLGAFSFDFAKTITTGEGGMLLAQDHKVLARARSWHDHGHANDGSGPRWMDAVTEPGFNFRMSELQAAVGLAQLEKLDRIVRAQRLNHEILARAVLAISGVEIRPVPAGGEPTADALVIVLGTAEESFSVRKAIVEAGLNTKILPEALRWHFAGNWEHLWSKAGRSFMEFQKVDNPSRRLLERCVALPVSLNMSSDLPAVLHKAVDSGISRVKAS